MCYFYNLTVGSYDVRSADFPLTYSLAWSFFDIAFSIRGLRDYKGLSEFAWRDYSFSLTQVQMCGHTHLFYRPMHLKLLTLVCGRVRFKS